MNIISLIQPQELGPDFYLDQGVWKVKFPTTAAPPPPISNDARNIIQNVGDGMYVDQRDRLAYAMVQDNQTQKIQLWQFPADNTFSIDTATMVSEIDMLAMNGQFDDIAIDEGVVTFTDAQTGLTLTLNTNELQRVGSIKSTNTVNVTETAGVLRLSAKIDPKANNLLEVTAGGLRVSPDKIKNIFNAELAKLDVHTQAIIPNEDIGLQHVIGNQIINIPKVMLANTAGVGIALVNDPNALQGSAVIVYPFKVTFNNNIEGSTAPKAFFKMIVNGVEYFDHVQDFWYADMQQIQGVSLSAIFSGGNISIIANYVGNTDPIHITMVPSSAQKQYSNKYVGSFHGAKVLPNGDLEFVLQPRVPI